MARDCPAADTLRHFLDDALPGDAQGQVSEGQVRRPSGPAGLAANVPAGRVSNLAGPCV
jgi:hypothetical protein